MKIYHPKFETMHKNLKAHGHKETSLCRWLWSMARTKELGPSMFKMLSNYLDKFERECH